MGTRVCVAQEGEDMSGVAEIDVESRRSGSRVVYTVREVSRMLSLSLSGTYVLVREGDIPARRLGGRWVIPKRVPRMAGDMGLS